MSPASLDGRDGKPTPVLPRLIALCRDDDRGVSYLAWGLADDGWVVKVHPRPGGQPGVSLFADTDEVEEELGSWVDHEPALNPQSGVAAGRAGPRGDHRLPLGDRPDQFSTEEGGDG